VSDIFDEVSAELRRDNMGAAWSKYGRYIIATAVAIVVLVALVIAGTSYLRGQEEAASQRYDALLETLVDLDTQAKIAPLETFVAAEDNGYGALARFTAALAHAEQSQNNAASADAAITSFDALADNSSLPDSLRDLAKLQSAIVLLDSQGSLQDIELRLDALLDDDNGLQPMARETMALAYMVNDKPLKARELFKAQIGDARVTSLSRERASIMLESLTGALTPPPAAPKAKK
jgi:hypothetical protein